jgi:hypothetical protein
MSGVLYPGVATWFTLTGTAIASGCGRQFLNSWRGDSARALEEINWDYFRIPRSGEDRLLGVATEAGFSDTWWQP